MMNSTPPPACLRRMDVVLDAGGMAQYTLRWGASEALFLNDGLGQSIRLEATGRIFCRHCGRSTKKSYQQGYCFVCCRRLAACDLCILKPETCHYAAGTCREPEWGLAHCFQPHMLYLAHTSVCKVGLTRRVNMPTRWLDQGAVCALPLLEVSQRYHAGLLEKALMEQVADKTNWRVMLRGGGTVTDLEEARRRLRPYVEAAVSQHGLASDKVTWLPDAALLNITYPVLEYPEKVVALSLDKTPCITGRLLGVKGQYLILECGVLNIRKFMGYEVVVQG